MPIRTISLVLLITGALRLGAAQNTDPFPTPSSKKGLQVQMVDDALALGIKHAALNFNLAQMIDLPQKPDSLEYKGDGHTHHFSCGYLQQMDRQIKPLSDSGVVVSLILLYYRSGRSELDKIMLHPGYDQAAPNNLSAFNTRTPEGARYLQACFEFLARRYSNSSQTNGRVWNYIVGNEVNSHWFWSNMGRVSMEEFAGDYLKAVRLCHDGVRKFSTHARVYLSLEHHWNIRYPGGEEKQAFPAKPFLEYFACRAREQGDFDWHVAFHPYPENLFECRTWLDKSALRTEDTPRITFKNIEVLTRYLQRPELLYQEQPRRVILSEQGFHSPKSPDGEKLQAAAYCYAWQKIRNLEGIDSFILHRHVDHAHEGGLNLGLWSRNQKSSSAAEPLAKRAIYEVFRLADTARWEEAFRFALPLIGIQSWNELE